MAKRILWVCDDNYVYPLIMAMGSVRQASADEFEFIVVNFPRWVNSNPLINATNLDLITKTCRALKFKLSVVNIELPDEELNQSRPTYGHINGTAWAKIFTYFLIDSTRFPEILYLDPDILVLTGFEEIFKVRCRAEVGIAARITPGHEAFEKKWSREFQHKTGSNLPKVNNWYFNSGVMKIDLVKFQNFGHWIDWRDLMENKHEYKLTLQDQDVLNALTVGQIDLIEKTYNCYPSEFSDGETKIIHYAGGFKPWYFRNPISRIKLNRNARAAIERWRLNERLVTSDLSKQLSKSDLKIIREQRKLVSKGFRFAIVKLFPSISSRKTIRYIYSIIRFSR